jgi:Tol biopolymer transport system component
MPSSDFDRSLTAWLEERAPARAPGHLLDDVVTRTRRTRPRSAWRIPERWLPVTIALRRAEMPRALLLVLLAALLVVVVAIGGAALGQRLTVFDGVAPLPPLSGPAGNGLIAYSSGGDIWTVSPDGSGARAITSGPATDFAPHWSLDGRHLAYWGQEGDAGPIALIVVEPDGANALTVARYASPVVGWFMSWSPDSTRLAYSAVPDGVESDCLQLDTWFCHWRAPVVGLEAAAPTLLGDPLLDARNPAWSPDGTRIAFGGGEHGVAVGLYVMGADGTDVRRLTSEAVARGGWGFVNQSWSPDGASIVTQDGRNLTEIWVVAADGSGESNISNHISDESIARYSPGGDAISWLRAGLGPVLSTAEAGVTALPVRSDQAPVWSPDGRLLLSASVSERSYLVFDRAGTVVTEFDARDLMAYPSWQRVAGP